MFTNLLDFTILQYATLFLFVGFAGFVDSIAGGGGLITVPTYIILGVPDHLILGTNKCVSTSGGTMAIYRYLKNGAVNLKVMIFGVIAAVVGSFFGAYLSRFLDNKKMVYLLILVVPVVLVLNYYKKKLLLKSTKDLSFKTMTRRCLAIGLIIGCYDGFFGPGTGTFLIIAMVFALHMGIVDASPNARIVNFSSNIAAFIYFLIKGLIAWKIAAVAIIASLVGNYLGSGVVLKGNHKVVTLVFELVLVVLLFKAIYDLVS
ncbi:MAG: TSUP family transporter [Bacteriovoracaceae bacterium]|nr:TSUP family transporter [Bacteriovoracaceae bacterium]